MVLMCRDGRATIAYVMNKMGPGILTSIESHRTDERPSARDFGPYRRAWSKSRIALWDQASRR